MIFLHCICICCALAAFANQETNLSDKAICGTEIILCPFQYHSIVLKYKRVMMDDLTSKGLVCEDDTTVSMSHFQQKVGFLGAAQVRNNVAHAARFLSIRRNAKS